MYTIGNTIMTYLCLSDVAPIGTLPTNKGYFTVLTIRGESGTGLSPRGNWSDAITYSANDLVVYDSKLWVAQSENLNVMPEDLVTEWTYLTLLPSLSVLPSEVILSEGVTLGDKVDIDGNLDADTLAGKFTTDFATATQGVKADAALPASSYTSISNAFLPTICGSNTAGTPAYTIRAGSYYRIGNLVHCNIWLSLNTWGGMVGALKIKDLPFAAKNTAGEYACVSFGQFTGVIFPAGCNTLQGTIAPNNSEIILIFSGSNVSPVYLTEVYATSSLDLMLSVTYEV